MEGRSKRDASDGRFGNGGRRKKNKTKKKTDKIKVKAVEAANHCKTHFQSRPNREALFSWEMWETDQKAVR